MIKAATSGSFFIWADNEIKQLNKGVKNDIIKI